MTSLYRVCSRAIAFGLLLLGSCRSNLEQPTPSTTQSTAINIEPLRKLFLDNKYDQQLVQKVNDQNQPTSYWTWVPQWNQATRTTLADSVTYTYVPLEAQIPVRPYVLTMVGVKKYLLFKQSPHSLNFLEASYLFKAKDNQPWSEANVRAFYDSFTGALLVKNFANGDVTGSIYTAGVKQARPATQAGNATANGKDASRPTSCYTMVTCYWYGVCASELEPHPTVTYGSVTYGVDFCVSPDDDGVGCSRIVWRSNGSDSRQICSSEDPNPGPGNTPGGGTNPTNPTTPTTTTTKSPCDEITTLATMPGFQTANTLAISMTQAHTEMGYVFRNGGNVNNDFAPFGPGSANGVDWPRIPGWKYDGYMHTHPGGYSVFSMSDISIIYAMMTEGYINNLSTFTIMVYTSYGDDYAIKVEDVNAFLNFAPKVADEYSVFIFESKNITTSSARYPLLPSNSPTNEQSLLRMLKDFNTGLKLFKHNRNNNTWQARGLDSNSMPVDNPCH